MPKCSHNRQKQSCKKCLVNKKNDNKFININYRNEKH